MNINDILSLIESKQEEQLYTNAAENGDILFTILNEARQQIKQTQNREVVFIACDFFKETFKRFENNPRITSRFKDFLVFKTTNPNDMFGHKDKTSDQSTPLYGYIHSGITNDLSVFYTKSGANPLIIRLFATLTHDEAGIGQPVNIRKQKQVAAKFEYQKENGNWVTVTA